MSEETPIPQPPGGCKLHGRSNLPGRLVLELQGRFFLVSQNPYFLTQEDAWTFWEAEQVAREEHEEQEKTLERKIKIVVPEGAHIH